MKTLCVLGVLLALAGCSGDKTGPAARQPAAAAAGSSIPVVNGDFEKTATDGTIPGWTVMMHADPGAFQMRVDGDGAYQGHGSFHITRVREEPYGNIGQDIDATPYVGKTLELSAMSKTRDVGQRGWKLLINGNAPGTLKYSSALTGTQDWQRQSVSLKVTPLVHKVMIGAILLDSGDAWLDDVELRVID
jgi:hypothetical protein